MSGSPCPDRLFHLCRMYAHSLSPPPLIPHLTRLFNDTDCSCRQIPSLVGSNGLCPCHIPLDLDLESANEDGREDWSRRRDKPGDFVLISPPRARGGGGGGRGGAD